MTGTGQARIAPVESVPATLREVMARFATGVTVLTATGEHTHGMTANAVTSVSLDPPLVLCCVARTARMHAAITSARHFGISVLGADQQDLARYFADKRRPSGRAQFDAVDWEPGPCTGAPLLTGSPAWLECELTELHEGGDHTIFLGSVLRSVRGVAGPGLVFYDGAFRPVPPRED